MSIFAPEKFIRYLSILQLRNTKWFSPGFAINPKLKQRQEQYRLSTLFYLIYITTVPISLDDISNFCVNSFWVSWQKWRNIIESKICIAYISLTNTYEKFSKNTYNKSWLFFGTEYSTYSTKQKLQGKERHIWYFYGLGQELRHCYILST